METKLFEVRDRITYIPVICTKLRPGNESDRYLLATCGFGLREDVQEQYVLYAPLYTGKLASVATDHPENPRTHRTAHDYIEQHWDELISGDVVDVEFIAGETKTAKISQRLEPC